MNELRSYGYSESIGNCSHNYLMPVVTSELRSLVGRKGRVLDLGCGDGAVTRLLARAGYDVVGVDVAEDGVRAARAAHSDLRFEVGSINDDDFADRVGREFDAVVSLEVVEHLYFPRRLFGRAAEVLKAGGGLVVSTPYHGYLKNLALSLANGWDHHFNVEWDGGHIKFFSPTSLTRMASQAGFRSLRVRGAGRLPWLWKSMVLSGRRG